MMPRLLATAIFTLNFLEANAKPWEDGRSLKEYQFKISCDREGLCEREGAPSEGGQLTSEPTAEPTTEPPTAEPTSEPTAEPTVDGVVRKHLLRYLGLQGVRVWPGLGRHPLPAHISGKYSLVS